MNVYRILKNGILNRRPMEGMIQQNHMEDAVVSIEKEDVAPEHVVFMDVLDTNDPATIQKYKDNLKVLSEQVKQDGFFSNFRLIREDNLFPYQWKWRVNSKDTYRTLARSNLCYCLRMAEAKKRLKGDHYTPEFTFEVPVRNKDLNEEASKLGPFYGRVYEPVRFRSTKHFTINTPLAYTGEYNQVESNRLFTVIDTPDAFCESGYGYSADYKDAYLDITHEELPISKDAIVLINEANYPKIIRNARITEQLQDRRVILYRGEEATAINMILTDEGVMPYRPGGRFYEYDPELDSIMIDGMKKFCEVNHLDYAQNHGNLFGKGGHFSDFLDSSNQERDDFESEFCRFLKDCLPEYKQLFTDSFYQYPDQVIQAVGHEKILDAVGAYNGWAAMDEVASRTRYDLERGMITPDIHELFVQTIQMIREAFHDQKSFPIPYELRDDLLEFFQSSSFQEQVDAAKRIQEYLSKKEK